MDGIQDPSRVIFLGDAVASLHIHEDLNAQLYQRGVGERYPFSLDFFTFFASCSPTCVHVPHVICNTRGAHREGSVFSEPRCRLGLSKWLFSLVRGGAGRGVRGDAFEAACGVPSAVFWMMELVSLGTSMMLMAIRIHVYVFASPEGVKRDL